ncbi:cysteinyl-tRNA synthetase [Candidatus Roizmanbacteria bacterium]|nr:cysteinyl-tRNA synthetase [Candidatus Roizmanbacteria bacterium]
MTQMPIDPSETQKKLIDERNLLRKAKEYTKADELRKQIEQNEYILIDEGEDTYLYKELEQKVQSGGHFLVLFGSGEISSTGRQVHEEVFKRIGKDSIKIAILTTPAGFQPNVDIVYREIGDFFVNKLQNFHPSLSYIRANTREDCYDQNQIHLLDDVDYIFTGPGSPTYAAKQLSNTPLLAKILSETKRGASLSLASAATCAFSKHVLPVYEIYKAGLPLYWEPGLNIYQSLFQELSIIPHFNNTEGGKKTDTSYCFMGKERFAALRNLLPLEEPVWGLDEHTGVIIDLHTKSYEVMGKGTLHPAI